MSLKAYVVSDSNNEIRVANMTEQEFIKSLENEVSELKARISELNKAKTEA